MRDRHAELLRAHPGTGKSELRPEACITMNAKWVLPWMWLRRNTDLEFVMFVTCEWMLTLCGVGVELVNGHPVLEVMEKHGVVLLVFTVGLSRSFFLSVYIIRGLSRSGRKMNMLIVM